MSSKNSVCGSTGTFVGTQGVCGVKSTTTGYNNVAIGYNSTSGPAGMSGHTGISGVPGVMTDWKDELMKKYHMRFSIKSEYDAMTFAPSFTIIDTNNFNEYKLKPKSISDSHIEVDEYIQKLIIDIREEKITNILK
jgi:hypothetical protein